MFFSLKKGRKGLSSNNLAAFLVGVVTGIFSWLVVKHGRKLLNQPILNVDAFRFTEEDPSSLEERGFLIAVANLLSGVEKRKLSDGQEKLILCAGRKNFREPWARDLCFASFGLVELEQNEVLKDSFKAFLKGQLPDGQLPIKLHSTTIPERYLHSIFHREQPVTKPMRPKYLSGHNTLSLDGNALLVIAILNYAYRLGDDEFVRDNWEALKRAMYWLDKHAIDEDGLLHQGVYSDWADSIARSGKVLYTNVVYWKALNDMAQAATHYGDKNDVDHFYNKAQQVGKEINKYFWRPDLGYYITNHQFDNLSSSGNLMAIAWNLASLEQAISILDRMDKYGMAEPVPTKVAYPPYPDRYVAIENRLGRIKYYHSEAAWLWLGAWHIIALSQIGRQKYAGELFKRMMNNVIHDGMVHEVYDPEGRFVSSFWYTSDAPFTWSSGMIVYAYQVYQRAINQDK